MPASRRSATVATGLLRLESFLPSSPSRRPWWTYSGGSKPSARASSSLLLGVGAMVGAADDGRDPEVVVVDDAGEVVGRRAVGAEQGQPAEPQRPLAVLGADRRRRPRGGARARPLWRTGPSSQSSRASGDRRRSRRPRPRARGRRRCRRCGGAATRRASGWRRPRARRRDGAARSGWARSGCGSSPPQCNGAPTARSRRRAPAGARRAGSGAASAPAPRAPTQRAATDPGEASTASLGSASAPKAPAASARAAKKITSRQTEGRPLSTPRR